MELVYIYNNSQILLLFLTAITIHERMSSKIINDDDAAWIRVPYLEEKGNRLAKMEASWCVINPMTNKTFFLKMSSLNKFKEMQSI